MKHLFYFLFVLSLSTAYAQLPPQTFVNLQWEQFAGSPDTLSWQATVYDEDGNAYIIGNTTNGFVTDMLVSKVDKTGTVEWSNTFNGAANLSDYGTAGFYQDGLLYTCGVVFTSVNNGFDYVVRVYDKEGYLQWSAVLNGQASGNDIPTAIAADEYGAVYVTGLSYNAATDYDYWTVKLDDTGALAWQAYYDYDSLPDAPALISVRSNGVTVTGVSSTSATEADVYIRRYDYDGAYVSESRVANPGVGRDAVTAFCRDAQGNYYLTGRMRTGTHHDILVIKLNQSLNVDWIKTFSNPGYDDWGNDIALDEDGNVYIAGTLSKGGNTKVAILLKLDNSGNYEWYRNSYANPDPLRSCEGNRLTLIDGNVIMATTFDYGGGLGCGLLLYEPSGIPLRYWEYNDALFSHKVRSLKAMADGEVYLTAFRAGANSDRKYAVVRFGLLEVPHSVVYDSLSMPLWLGNQLIVRFEPWMLLNEAIDNRGLQYGTLQDFLKQPFCDSLISYLPQQDSRAVRLVKLAKNMTSSDTLMINRLGETVHNMWPWATMLMVFGEDIDVLATAHNFKPLFPKLTYAAPNMLNIQLASFPNDSAFMELKQKSLVFNTTYPGSDINVDSAWLINKGSDSLVVGLFDSVLEWRHYDFRKDTAIQYGLGRKIEFGMDYYNNMLLPALNPPDAGGHGTAMAGIFGAVSNNNRGIAGIAGGDYLHPDTLMGVHIIVYKLFDCSGPGCGYPLSKFIEAVNDAVAQNPNGSGPMVDLMNNSWVTMPIPSILLDPAVPPLRDVYRRAFLAAVPTVSARGNQGTILSGGPRFLPACFEDDWQISVGASGTDGNLIFQNAGNNADPFTSSYSGGIDLVAPGTLLLIYTTGDTTFNNYTKSNGSSAATAHVTGAASLLMSENDIFMHPHPDNMAPEDVEHMLQFYASHSTVYDSLTGWGLLNAGKSLAHFDRPKFKLLHFETGANLILPIDTGTFHLAYDYYWDVGIAVSKDTPIHLITQKVTANVSLNLPPSTIALHAWIRNSSSNLWGIPDSTGILYPERRAKLDSWSQTSASLSGYYYNRFGCSPCNTGLPHYMFSYFAGAYISPKFAFSVLVYDTAYLDTVITHSPLIVSQGIIAYPNPVQNQISIQFDVEDAALVDIEICDLSGRILRRYAYRPTQLGMNRLNMDVSTLVSGAYFIRVSDSVRLRTFKFIKI